jgi:hypothetical protein
MWHPRFLISVISANGRIRRVKPADNGQTWVNLGRHPENLANKPYWTPWPSLHTAVVNPWSKTRSNPTETLMSMNVLRNFCRVLQNSPKHLKIYLYESCPSCWWTQLSCRLAFPILSGKGWKLGQLAVPPVHRDMAAFNVGKPILQNPWRKTP